MQSQHHRQGKGSQIFACLLHLFHGTLFDIQGNGRPKGEALGPIGRGYTVARVFAASHALTAQAASGGLLPFVPYP